MISQKHKKTGSLDALDVRIALVRRAALNQDPVSGLTHQFYRYPARFSPRFVRTAIEAFSSPGDVILDPYMGGGTTIVEAYTAGRRSIGNDVNSLAVFVAATKLRPLSASEQSVIRNWASETVCNLRCNVPVVSRSHDVNRVPRNMSLPQVRWLKKTIEQCLATIESEISAERARQFARCVVLNVGQWTLNGRRRIPAVHEFRERIAIAATEMLEGVSEMRDVLATTASGPFEPLLVEGDAENLFSHQEVQDAGLANLIVTSPPYPGIHMLYHRWQVDGRKESDAPYWITATNDGAGAAFYNFADRRREAEDRYFDKAERAFSSIRKVTRDGALLVQLIAFADPPRRFLLYLGNRRLAEFRDLGWANLAA